jgi:hypothetical protein
MYEDQARRQALPVVSRQKKNQVSVMPSPTDEQIDPFQDLLPRAQIKIVISANTLPSTSMRANLCSENDHR